MALAVADSHLAENAQRIRVLIAERDRMASQLLAESLERDARYEVVAMPAVNELLSVATLRKPDVAVISFNLGTSSGKGLQIVRTFNMRLPNVRVVILLDELVRESVVSAFRSGAIGVFCRTAQVSEFRACVEQVSRGELWAKDGAAEYLLEALRSSPSCDAIDGNTTKLSKREKEVVECAVQGQTNRQIAAQLQLSEHTVKNYLFRVFEKLGVSNRMELLFLLSTHNKNLPSTPLNTERSTNSPQEYLKAAQEGRVFAQFMVGSAYCEGRGIEKNDQSAYYWLRMAEENSKELRDRSRTLIQEVTARMTVQDIEAMDKNVEKNLMSQRQKMLNDRKISDITKGDASAEKQPRKPALHKTA
jgi:two-component system, NarL family, nitrate/nitrite response regulator NarL